MTLTTDLTKLMIQDAHSLTSRYPHLLQFSLADDGVQQAVEKRFASGQIPNGIHLLPAHQAAAPTIATTRRLRRASVLAGVSLVLFGLASASPALATQEPIIDDLSIPNPPLVSCFGQPVDMWVPPGGGTFYGDNNDNVIMGTGGDDRIFGGGGIDRICQPDGDATGGMMSIDPTATDGFDSVWGEGGGDYIDGGSDGDVIYGDVGEDFLHGGEGGDIIWGGDQNDTLYGDSDDDGFNCGGGFDTATGGLGNDFRNPSAPQASCNVFIQ